MTVRHAWLLFLSVVVASCGRSLTPAECDALLDRYGLRPEATAFIDDRPENVEAARQLGLLGIRFTDADSLRRELRGMGLLGPS